MDFRFKLRYDLPEGQSHPGLVVPAPAKEISQIPGNNQIHGRSDFRVRNDAFDLSRILEEGKGLLHG